MGEPFRVIVTSGNPNEETVAVYVPFPRSVAITGAPPSSVTTTRSPPRPTGFPCASLAVTVAFTLKKFQFTSAVLAPGLTGPGTTALVNGLPATGAPPTRTATRSLPATTGL